MVKKLDPQKHAGQKTRLLAHARHLFAVQGVKETSMSQVAGACQITKATLYHYFKNKADILKEILHCSGKGQEWTTAAQPQTLEEFLSLIALEHLKKMENPENLESMKLMLSEAPKDRHIRQMYMEFMRESVDWGAHRVASFGAVKKTEKERRLLFFQFVSTLAHYTWNMKMMGDPSDFIGDEHFFVRQLAKTYARAFQEA